MSDSKDKEVKQDSKELEQKEADRERTKKERQQAVEEAAKSGFGTVYTRTGGSTTDKEKYPKTGSQDPKASEPPSKDTKDKK